MQRRKMETHLLERVGVKENPSKLNDLSGILGYVDTVLVTRRGHMDHDVAVDVELRLRRHDGRRSVRLDSNAGLENGGSVDAGCSLVDLSPKKELGEKGAAACDPAGSMRMRAGCGMGSGDADSKLFRRLCRAKEPQTRELENPTVRRGT